MVNASIDGTYTKILQCTHYNFFKQTVILFISICNNLALSRHASILLDLAASTA